MCRRSFLLDSADRRGIDPLFGRSAMCPCAFGPRCRPKQGNRVLTKEHLEEVVLDPTGFKPFTLDTPFESGFLLQHIEGNLA